MDLYDPPRVPAVEAGQRSRRKVWPWAAGALVLAAVAGAGVSLVQRPDATAEPSDQLLLADGVVAGGAASGQAQELAVALGRSGLECSVRFTAANGGHAGCFGFAEAERVVSEVRYQYAPDGSVVNFNINVTTPEPLDTRPLLRGLVGAVLPVVFPSDRADATRLLNAWGGSGDGAWGSYEAITRGPKTSFSGTKTSSPALDVPVLHLDTTESALANALRTNGFTCSRDNESCRTKSGSTVQMSGPDTGITYLLAATTAGQNTPATFAALHQQLLNHLTGPAVAPLRQWLTAHADGRSHSAYVAGWRVDLQAFHPSGDAKQPPGHLRLTLFNEEVWQIPE
jgi:hypothetical protein